MQLYAGSSKQFIEDTVQNRVADLLRTSFFRHCRFYPPASEVNSWRNSLRAMCNVVQYAGLTDNGVLLEYQLPLTSKRLDCMLTGQNPEARDNAVIVELKQWEKTEPSAVEDCVTVWLGQGMRDVLHPSRQVGNYQQYLEDCHTAFSSDAIALASCSYLHNLTFNTENELFHARHQRLLREFPLFTGDQTDKLAGFLAIRIGQGKGEPILDTVLKSKYKATKKLLDHTAAMIQNQPTYVLLDEQQVVFNSVLTLAKTARADYHKIGKTVLLVKGGPGTGKSVIALNLMGALSALGYNTQHATGSRAFTENVRKIVGSRAGQQFRYFNSYREAERDIIDVLVCDEAHRLRPSSSDRFRPALNTGKAQIEELIDSAKVSVFFIDDLQVVRPGEIGSTDLIRSAATKRQAALQEFELEAQFRCNGSDAFINWIDNTLGIRRTANVLWDSDDPFEFRIAESVEALQQMIRANNDSGFTARMAAGFCWEWSDPTPNGTLVNDVVIGDWSMPWNAKPDSTRLAKGIPKSHYWASDVAGIDQVGCVYTAQGFEFDYVGVIFGRDLRYDPKGGNWVGDKAVSHDSVVKKRSGVRFDELVKNTYRVLLSRGLKGCYVYFQDEATKNFFQSRVERTVST